MHRFAIAAASLIAATALLGGCEKGPTSQPEPEAVSTVAVPEATPKPEPERTEYFTLLALCQSGDATPERIQEFLDLRVDLNVLGGLSSMTPLHCVARYNDNPEVITILIKAGADVNKKDGEGRTPLFTAAHYNKNPEVLTILIKAGAWINASNHFGVTPLSTAAFNSENPEALRILIKAGAKVNAKDGDGQTPLHSAAGSNWNPEVLTILIKAGADVNAKDNDGKTPLDRASERNKQKNAEALRAAGGKLGKDLP